MAVMTEQGSTTLELAPTDRNLHHLPPGSPGRRTEYVQKTRSSVPEPIARHGRPCGSPDVVEPLVSLLWGQGSAVDFSLE